MVDLVVAGEVFMVALAVIGTVFGVISAVLWLLELGFKILGALLHGIGWLLFLPLLLPLLIVGLLVGAVVFAAVIPALPLVLLAFFAVWLVRRRAPAQPA